jgi:hypothetical protein
MFYKSWYNGIQIFETDYQSSKPWTAIFITVSYTLRSLWSQITKRLGTPSATDYINQLNAFLGNNCCLLYHTNTLSGDKLLDVKSTWYV